jgi:glucokinase
LSRLRRHPKIKGEERLTSNARTVSRWVVLYSLILMSTAVISISPSEAKRPLFVGVDVGGTNIKIGIVDDLGRSLGKVSIPTREQEGPAIAMDRTAQALREALAAHGASLRDIAAIGLGSPGPQDVKTGYVIAPDNLPHWRDFPIVDYLSKQCDGLPVSYANDANAAAFGECWVGTGREYHSIVLFTLGTGVGGGIIIGDLLIDGEHSHGGELGHVIIDYHDNARWCASGQGRLEGYASATAVVSRTEEALAAGRKSSLSGRIEDGEALTTLMLMEEAAQGDKLSRELILETGFYLGIGVVTMIHAVNPSAVVIGGAMTFGGNDHEIGRAFIEEVRRVVRERAFPIPASRTVVDFASLGGDAGYIGAAGIARTAFLKSKA